MVLGFAWNNLRGRVPNRNTRTSVHAIAISRIPRGPSVMYCNGLMGKL